MTLGSGEMRTVDGAVEADELALIALDAIRVEFKARRQEAHDSGDRDERRRMNGALREIEVVMDYVQGRRQRMIRSTPRTGVG